MAPLVTVGSTIPDADLAYVPHDPEVGDDVVVCSMPGTLKTSQWAGKKVVLVGVPGAFTPTCTANHLPPYLQKYTELKNKGVDEVAFIATNDPFVMSAWGKSLKVGDKIVMLADPTGQFLDKLGLIIEGSANPHRSKRFAIVLDDLKVKSVEVETGKGVTVSGVDDVLSKL